MISEDAGKLTHSTAYVFGEFTLEAQNLLLLKNSEIVPLPPKAVEVLVALIERNGKLITKQELLDTVWANTFVEEANLTHHISALRKALSEDKNGRKFIETIPRRGYRFVHPVAEVSGSTKHKTAAASPAEIVFSERTSERIFAEQEIEFSTAGDTSGASAEDAAEETVTNAHKILPRRLSQKRRRKSNLRRVLLVIAAAIVAVAAGMFIWRKFEPSPLPVFFDDSARSKFRFSQLIESKGAELGSIGELQFSPDNRFVAFQRGKGPISAIYVKQIDGGDPVRLTEGKWLDVRPIWTRDGARIAFLSNRDGFQGVWTIPFLGGTPALLKKLDYSPDVHLRLLKFGNSGDRLFLTVDEKLYSVGLNDAAPPAALVDLKDAFESSGDFAVSPDDSTCAFYARKEGEVQIYTKSIASENTEAPRRITTGSGLKRQPAWFADGKNLAYSADESGNFQIYIVSAASGESVQLTSSALDNTKPIVASDNRTIIFSERKNAANIYSYSLSDGRETARTDSTGLQLFPAAAPDGGRVAFQSSGSTMKFFESNLKIVSLDEARRTLDIAAGGFEPHWSPDGETLVFVRRKNGVANLWKVSANGRNEMQLTKEGIDAAGFAVAPFNLDNPNFAFSPDGNRIVYSSVKSGSVNVWAISAKEDGAGDVQITQDAGAAKWMNGFSWSPDASRVAFALQTKTRDDETPAAFRVSVTNATGSGKFETLYETANLTRVLGWSGDGQNIYFAEREPADETGAETVIVRRISGSGANQTEIIRLPAAEIKSLRISPDAANLIFTQNPNGKKGENVFLLALTGSGNAGREPRRLTDNTDASIYYSGIGWAPDGKTIFYSKQTVGDLFALLTINQ